MTKTSILYVPSNVSIFFLTHTHRKNTHTREKNSFFGELCVCVPFFNTKDFFSIFF